MQQQQPTAAHYHGQQQQQQQQQMTTTVIVNQSTSTGGQISFQQQQAGERNIQVFFLYRNLLIFMPYLCALVVDFEKRSWTNSGGASRRAAAAAAVVVLSAAAATSAPQQLPAPSAALADCQPEPIRIRNRHHSGKKTSHCCAFRYILSNTFLSVRRTLLP